MYILVWPYYLKEMALSSLNEPLHSPTLFDLVSASIWAAV